MHAAPRRAGTGPRAEPPSGAERRPSLGRARRRAVALRIRGSRRWCPARAGRGSSTPAPSGLAQRTPEQGSHHTTTGDASRSPEAAGRRRCRRARGARGDRDTGGARHEAFAEPGCRCIVGGDVRTSQWTRPVRCRGHLAHHHVDADRHSAGGFRPESPGDPARHISGHRLERQRHRGVAIDLPLRLQARRGQGALFRRARGAPAGPRDLGVVLEPFPDVAGHEP